MLHFPTDATQLDNGDIQFTSYFTKPLIVAHASRLMTLSRGALLGSGTAGTGCILEFRPENTKDWRTSGDFVEPTIEKLGTLTNTIF